MKCPPVKTPLRYPGGKSKALAQIRPFIPSDIVEFREPFVGGASVFLDTKMRRQDSVQQYWINDLNYDLYCFWRCTRDCIHEVVEAVRFFKHTYPDGRALYAYFTNPAQEYTDFDRAVRFFILNRITFSGVVDAGGYSQEAFEKRFTESSIDRLWRVSPHLDSVKITQGDFEPLLQADGEGVFIFLDPPYFKATASRLYGKRGILHTNFDHARLASALQHCRHRWLITYDDSPEIRSLFSFAEVIQTWELQYGMNNYKQDKAAKGKELFIRNYS